MASEAQGTSALFEIAFDLPPKGGRRSAQSIYAQLRAAIVDGRLVAGAKLPVERQSAVFLPRIRQGRKLLGLYFDR